MRIDIPRLTLFPKATAWNNECMVEGNEGTLARTVVRSHRAQSGTVSFSDQLRPETIDSTRPGLDKRVGYIVQKRRLCVEIGQRYCLQF